MAHAYLRYLETYLIASNLLVFTKNYWKLLDYLRFLLFSISFASNTNELLPGECRTCTSDKATCSYAMKYFKTGRSGLKHCMQQLFFGGRMTFKFYKYVFPFMDFQKLNLCEVLTCKSKMICMIILPIGSEHSYNTMQSIIIFFPPATSLNKTKTNPQIYNVETT